MNPQKNPSPLQETAGRARDVGSKPCPVAAILPVSNVQHATIEGPWPTTSSRPPGEATAQPRITAPDQCAAARHKHPPHIASACISLLCQASFFDSFVAGKNLHTEFTKCCKAPSDVAYAPTLVELVGVLLPCVTPPADLFRIYSSRRQ